MRKLIYWVVVIAVALVVGWLVSALFVRKVPLLAQSPAEYQGTALVVIRGLKAFFWALVAAFVVAIAHELVPPDQSKDKTTV
jgi:hypothetical protein